MMNTKQIYPLDTEIGQKESKVRAYLADDANKANAGYLLLEYNFRTVDDSYKCAMEYCERVITAARKVD